jgi:hypothetical protein
MSPSSHMKTETRIFRKAEFSSYLEFRTKDNAHKASESDWCMPVLHLVADRFHIQKKSIKHNLRNITLIKLSPK